MKFWNAPVLDETSTIRSSSTLCFGICFTYPTESLCTWRHIIDPHQLCGSEWSLCFTYPTDFPSTWWYTYHRQQLCGSEWNLYSYIIQRNPPVLDETSMIRSSSTLWFRMNFVFHLSNGTPKYLTIHPWSSSPVWFWMKIAFQYVSTTQRNPQVHKIVMILFNHSSNQPFFQSCNICGSEWRLNLDRPTESSITWWDINGLNQLLCDYAVQNED